MAERVRTCRGCWWTRVDLGLSGARIDAEGIARRPTGGRDVHRERQRCSGSTAYVSLPMRLDGLRSARPHLIGARDGFGDGQTLGVAIVDVERLRGAGLIVNRLKLRESS